MHIGTAKPSADELAAVPHHFIGFLPLDTSFSAGEYSRLAKQRLEELFATRDTVILCGGSGLFVRALLSGLDDLPHSPAIRHELMVLQASEGTPALARQLQDLDPDYCRTADLQNTQRVMRALEVCLASGRPYSTFLSGPRPDLPFRVIPIGLNTDRPLLYERINHRVDKMLESGLLAEVKSLLPQRQLNALRTVGYSELFAYLDGTLTLDEATERIKQNTRNFAKRQITWFNREPDIRWFAPDDRQGIDEYLNQKMA